MRLVISHIADRLAGPWFAHVTAADAAQAEQARTDAIENSVYTGLDRPRR